MIRGLESVLASRKAFIDATASRDFVAGASPNSAAATAQPKVALQQLVTRPSHGFVGLFNQGATCYLNSFIQALYMLPAFRRGVFAFRLPGGHAPESSVARQLQLLFLRLRCGVNGATSTAGLTKSFGWGMEEVFQQQDVQELFQKLFEAMQLSVQDSTNPASSDATTPDDPNVHLARALQSFIGTQTSYVECQTCHTRTERRETFLNLLLHIKGVESVEDAFRELMKPEVLEGDNAYRCSVCARKETARKGIEFVGELPEVLSLQLARFEMDWNRMQRVKTTSLCQFQQKMDLAPFITQPKEGETDTLKPKPSTLYELTAILVHSGAAAAGHYFAYILDTASGRYLKFNDTIVEYASAEEMEGIFGEASTEAMEAQRLRELEEEAQRQRQRAAKEAAQNRAAMAVATTRDAAPAEIAAAAKAVAAAANDELLNGASENSDSDDEETASLETARNRGPFVDPKKHAYILIYRRVPNTAADADVASATSSAASTATTADEMSADELQSLASTVAPEILAENAEFERRFREQKEAENKITIEVHYDPLASSTSDMSEKERQAKEDAASAMATPAAPDAPATHTNGMPNAPPPPGPPAAPAAPQMFESCLTTHTLTVSKDLTLAALLEAIYSTLDLKAFGIALEDARIRGWDGLRHTGERPFAPEDLAYKTIRRWIASGQNGGTSSARRATKKTVLLEVRQPGGEFPKYKPKTIGLSLVECDVDRSVEAAEVAVSAAANTPAPGATPSASPEPVLPSTNLPCVEKPSRHIEADPDGTLAELRVQVASMMAGAPDASRVKLILSSHGLAIELVEQTKTLTQLRVLKSDTIYAEVVPEGARYDDPVVKSGVLAMFDARQYLIAIKCNNPFVGVPADVLPEHVRPQWTEDFATVSIDARSSLGALKELIARQCLNGLSTGEFRLRLTHTSPELKDLSKKLSYYGLNGFLYLELGKPLAPDEFVLRILQWRPDKLAKPATVEPVVPPTAPPMAPPLGAPVAPSFAPVVPPCAPPMGPPCAPPIAPPCAPPLAPPCPPGPSAAPVAPGAPSIGAPPLSGGGSSALAPGAPLHLGPNDPFEVLGDLVLRESLTLDETKTAILAAFPHCLDVPDAESVEGAASIAHMRLREKLAQKLTRVFRTDQTLRGNCTPGTLKDFKLLVVERLPSDHPHPHVTSGEVLLYTQRWHPKDRRLDAEMKERILPVDTKLQALQQLVGEEAAADTAEEPIPADSVGFEKPLPYQLTDLVSLASLKFNMDWVTPESTLANGHVFKVRDGDLLLWCDRRVNDTVQYNPYNEADDIVGHDGQARGREAQRELKIWTPAEQAEMQRAIQLARELDEQERRVADNATTTTTAL